ncbi:hypothetical protein GCM10007424_27890 [Flavobacterium suaedae]|uniref:DUF4919 domain-containing protein n=1 Tax=Flavobacterium suaedae TaxID=1767027 RepID=A0ABQ1K7R5_9FLAO|nr:hypothetical protein [Flavobacterium suaedae]GGB86248.1 hypothetical protein GCM10007424_27890 [Flavobacterium suaedae]
MKNYLALIILIIIPSSYCIAQNSKNILLERDHEQIIERLELMNYLNDITMKLKATLKKDNSSFNFPHYYRDSIVGNNPISVLDISSYLDYKENEIPVSIKGFINRVYEKNAFTLFNIIRGYGYPSTSRLNKFEKIDPYRATFIITMASDKWKQILYPIIEEQNRVGNITELEYTFCKVAFKNGILNEKESIATDKVLNAHGYRGVKVD